MSEKTLATKENLIPTTKVDRETIEQFLFGSGSKLSEKEKEFFIQMALRNNLDPFKREIYIIKYGNGFNIVTGYQVYIQRAEATGLLDGWEVEVIRDEDNKVIGARVRIYRKDWSKPFVWEVSREEFDRGTANWKNMPEFMIKKVAIGQGFRLAFPNELGGLPYLQEELDGIHQYQNNDFQNNEEVEPEVVEDNEITQRQVNAIHALANKKKVNIHQIIWEKYGLEDIKELTKQQASHLIEELQNIEEEENISF